MLFNYNGKTTTLQGLAKIANVPLEEMLHRVYVSATIDDAITDIPSRKSCKKIYRYKKQLVSLKYIARKENIPYPTLYSRVIRDGKPLWNSLSHEDCVDERFKLVIDGKNLSLANFCKIKKLNRAYFYYFYRICKKNIKTAIKLTKRSEERKMSRKKIKELKEKIKDPDYINNAIDSIAKKIADGDINLEKS